MTPQRRSRVPARALCLAFLVALASACATAPPPRPTPPAPAPEPRTTPEPEGLLRERVVTASAYTSHRNQTHGDPFVAAWGDQLSPEMKVIAVSRDLLREGLGRGARVQIEGLPGEYVVLDKMHRRWRNKIDIYMGRDLAAARRWGVREVRIRWREATP